MTSNQLKASEIEESRRTNRAKERETERSNRANEKQRERDYKQRYITTGLQTLGSVGGAAIKALNDPSWYNQNPQLTKDVASFPYGVPVGVPFAKGLNGRVGATTEVTSKTSIPGVMILHWAPALGSRRDYKTDAINIATKQIYAFVRHANSGHTNYDSPDLMMYLLAMDSIYSFHSEMCRLYSLLLTAKGENRFYSEAIIKGLGYDYADLSQHIADLRAYINLYATRANAFYVPNLFNYYTRHYWLNSRIYKDQNIKRSSEYAFQQQFYWKYDNGTSASPAVGSNLQAVQFTKGGFNMTYYGGQVTPKYNKFTDIRTFGDNLINALVVEEDIGIMSGDILKAFGSDLFALQMIDANYHVDSEYNQEVLTQINAATLNGPIDHPDDQDTTGLSVVQTKDGFIVQGKWSTSSTGIEVTPGIRINKSSNNNAVIDNSLLCQTPILNMYKDDVTVDDSMVASRLISYQEANVSSDVTGIIVTCSGSEILTDAVIMWYSEDPANANMSTLVGRQVFDIMSCDKLTNTSSNQLNPTTFDSFARKTATLTSLINSFDWAPRIRVCATLEISSSSASYSVLADNIDFANYYVMNISDLSTVHDIAIYSLFAIDKLRGRAVK